jgi:hypothetical protein
MPSHIIGNDRKNGFTLIRDQLIAYAGLNPSKVYPRVWWR